MKPFLEMKLKAALHLSQEMRQALHILSLPLTEMEEYIYSQVPSVYSVANGQEVDLEAPAPSLFEEIKDIFASEKEREMGEMLFHHFDKNGLCRENLEEIAERYAFDKEELQKILRLIQTTFQNGIGATSFQEAFLLQLPENSAAYILLRDHYDDFLHRRHNKIAKKLQLSIEDIEMIIKEDILPLRIPLLETAGPSAPAIFPDIFLSHEEEWNIDVPSPELPPGSWFYTICERRALILKSISLYLVHHISDYLLGAPYLPPLLLKDLAHTLDLAESTITRAVADKYISCPRGLLPLRDLFSLPLQEGLSTQKAKAILLELLQTESALSDAKLSELMKQRGIPIERRTVAKYRNELGFLPSHQR